MITVTHCNKSYTCDVAIKGSDYIHLVDSDGNLLTTFDGISGFDGFSISGGTWTTPQNITECKLAAIREDGTVCSSNRTVKNVLTGNTPFNGPIILAGSSIFGSTLPTNPAEGQLFFKLDT